MAPDPDLFLKSRKSCRAFRPDPVTRDVVEAILKIACHAPSGSNIQPWKAYVAAGAVRDGLVEAMLAAFDAGEREEDREYHYYPQNWREPFLSRRRATGFGLYRVLGIEREDRDRRREQARRNFSFFDAPVGVVLALDNDVEIGSWLDLGMFAQTLMLAACARGLATCPQVSVARMHDILHARLGIPESECVVMGIALGYEDRDAIENTFQPVREEPGRYARLLGF